MLGQREAHLQVLAVIHGVVLAQEGIAEDEQRTLRWRNVQGHQSQGAPVLTAIHVLLGLEIEDVVPDEEAHVRQGLEIAAIRGHCEAVNQCIHHLSRPGHERRAGVDSHLAMLGLAQVLLLVLDGDISHFHLPIPGVGHRHPKQRRRHSILAPFTEGDLALLIIRGTEEEGVQVGLQSLVPHHTIEDVEPGPLGHLRQGQAKNPIEGNQAEGLIGLLGRRNEIGLRAQAPDADRVLDKNTAHLSGAEGNGDDVTVPSLVDRLVRRIRKGNLHRGLRSIHIVPLVRQARRVIALLGGDQQVARAGVKHHHELLRG
mmetsp:Transcript_2682/g.6423  ORF Transcript_2682/g.6423 Transcript_2682/m.6423 type:complete len:314 (-) Transcript_2682:330-1271(-)